MSKLAEVYRRLLDEHGPQGWWPIVNSSTLVAEYHLQAPRDRLETFEICIGAILTQNTNWHPNAVRSIQQLKIGRPLLQKESEAIARGERNAKCLLASGRLLRESAAVLGAEDGKEKVSLIDGKSRLTPGRILSLDPMDLREMIRPSRYYNQKTRKILEFTRCFQELIGKVPARELLLSVWGIGKETADSMLLYGFGVPTFIVDEYTRRMVMAKKLMDPDASYDEIRKYFERNLAPDLEAYREFHALIVAWGQTSKLKSSKPHGDAF